MEWLVWLQCFPILPLGVVLVVCLVGGWGREAPPACLCPCPQWTGCHSGRSDTLSTLASYHRDPQHWPGWGFEWLFFEEQHEKNIVCHFPGPRDSPEAGTVVLWGKRTCPEMLLDLKNTEPSASINYQAVTSRQTPPSLRERRRLQVGRKMSVENSCGFFQAID